MTDKLYGHHHHHGKQRAAEYAKQQVTDIGKREGFEKKQGRVVEKHRDKGIPHKGPYTQGVDAWFEIFELVARREQAQQVGAQESHKHRSSRIDTQGIAEDVDRKAQKEGQQHEHVMVGVPVHDQEQIDIDERGGQAKQADVIEQQHLYKYQRDKPCYAGE